MCYFSKVGGLTSSRASCCLGVREGLAWRGKGSGAVPGGVGGRGTGPGTEQISQRVGGVSHRSWPGGRGVDQGRGLGGA